MKAPLPCPVCTKVMFCSYKCRWDSMFIFIFSICVHKYLDTFKDDGHVYKDWERLLACWVRESASIQCFLSQQWRAASRDSWARVQILKWESSAFASGQKCFCIRVKEVIKPTCIQIDLGDMPGRSSPTFLRRVRDWDWLSATTSAHQLR